MHICFIIFFPLNLSSYTCKVNHKRNSAPWQCWVSQWVSLVAGCETLFPVLPGVYYAAIGQIWYYIFIPYAVLLREALFHTRTSKLSLWRTSKRRRPIYTVTRTILLQGQFFGNSLSQGQKCLQFSRQGDSKRYEFYVYPCSYHGYALLYVINTVLCQF